MSHGSRSEELESVVEVARHVLTRLPGARSPLVLFDRDSLGAQVALWRRHLPDVVPHFAIKSCDALPVLAHFDALGLSFDAATAGEIELLERLGVASERVICTHPIRDEHDLVAIARYRPRALVVEDAAELRKLLHAGVPSADYSPEIFLRIELPFGGLSQKFGAEIVFPREGQLGLNHYQLSLAAARRVFAELRRIEDETGHRYGRLGLSSHVGTNTSKTEKYAMMLRVFEHARAELAEAGVGISVFNLGGGYCDAEAPRKTGASQEEFLARFGDLLAGFRATHPDVELIAEPGRFMVAGSGAVVIRVMHVARRELLPPRTEEEAWQMVPHLKVQMNDGLYGNLLGERHDDKEWKFIPFRKAADARPFSTTRIAVILNGKTCDSWDQLDHNRALPADLAVGDFLLVPNAGAYTIVTATNFNLAPRSQLCFYWRDAAGEPECRLYDATGAEVVDGPPAGALSSWAEPPSQSLPAHSLSERLSRVPTLSRVAGSLAGEVQAGLLRPGPVIGSGPWQRVVNLIALNDLTLKVRDVEPLAEGGMGWVLRVTEGLGQRAALKIGKFAAHGALRERFQAEVAKTSELQDDPRIPVIFRSGILPEGGQPFYTMELIEGQTLEQLCPGLHSLVGPGRATSWRVGERRTVLAHLVQVAEALEYAHRRGVLHRDVKPSNLMVPDDPRLPIKVLDWGLLKAGFEEQMIVNGGGDRPGLTRTGSVLGTVDYMSPEQACGAEVTQATDVWALGATLYRVLCNRAPLEHLGDEEQRLAGLRSDSAGRPELVNLSCERSLPVELAAVLKRALALDPGARYSSAEALGSDLRCFLARKPVAAYRASLSVPGAIGYSLNLGARRHSRLLAVIGAVLLALLVGLQTIVGQAGEIETLAPRAELYRLLGLRAEAEVLYPIAPELVDRATVWIGEARALAARRDEYLERRLPLERAVEQGADDPDVRDSLRVLDALVAGAEALEGSGPQSITDVQRRIDATRRVESESSLSPAALESWREATAAIQAAPAYGGLTLAPQVGLLPLGPDPESGLWEFVDLLTGGAPVRDATGRLAQDAAHGIVLVLLPAGRSLMGTQEAEPKGPNYQSGGGSQHGPVHPVELDAFFLGKTEVTQAQWGRWSDLEPSYHREGASPGLLPVETVNWHEASLWAEHLGLRLPTEAEWEYGCRAGTTTAWFFGHEPALGHLYANIRGLDARGSQVDGVEKVLDGFVYSAPVASLLPNPWGLHDMLGNVNEWCAGSYTAYPGYEGRNPVFGRSEIAPLRGGGYHQRFQNAACGYRDNEVRRMAYRTIGFRVARSIR